MNQRSLIAIIILAGIGSITAVSAYSGTISAGQGNFNNVLVTGTCTGCGGGEGSFTTYSLALNETVSGTSGWVGTEVKMSTNGASVISDNHGFNSIVKLDGTVVSTSQANISNPGQHQIDSSSTGEYKTLLDSSNNLIIYKNNVLLQTITLDYTSNFFNNAGQLSIGISSDGKYIGVYGPDVTDGINRIQVYEGS